MQQISALHFAEHFLNVNARAERDNLLTMLCAAYTRQVINLGPWYNPSFFLKFDELIHRLLVGPGYGGNETAYRNSGRLLLLHRLVKTLKHASGVSQELLAGKPISLEIQKPPLDVFDFHLDLLDRVQSACSTEQEVPSDPSASFDVEQYASEIRDSFAAAHAQSVVQCGSTVANSIPRYVSDSESLWNELGTFILNPASRDERHIWSQADTLSCIVAAVNERFIADAKDYVQDAQADMNEDQNIRSALLQLADEHWAKVTHICIRCTLAVPSYAAK